MPRALLGGATAARRLVPANDNPRPRGRVLLARLVLLGLVGVLVIAIVRAW